MAQATAEHIPVHASPAMRSWHPLDIECDLSDLEQMANLAQIAVYEAIGETRFEDGEVVSHTITDENISRARFAVSHLIDMIEDLQAKLYGSPSKILALVRDKD